MSWGCLRKFSYLSDECNNLLCQQIWQNWITKRLEKGLDGRRESHRDSILNTCWTMTRRSNSSKIPRVSREMSLDLGFRPGHGAWNWLVFGKEGVRNDSQQTMQITEFWFFRWMLCELSSNQVSIERHFLVTRVVGLQRERGCKAVLGLFPQKSSPVLFRTLAILNHFVLKKGVKAVSHPLITCLSVAQKWWFWKDPETLKWSNILSLLLQPIRG